jgi:hypothetical protein
VELVPAGAGAQRKTLSAVDESVEGDPRAVVTVPPPSPRGSGTWVRIWARDGSCCMDRPLPVAEAVRQGTPEQHQVADTWLGEGVVGRHDGFTTTVLL